VACLPTHQVDFAKSGNPVHFDELPKRIHPYTPDFQHKETTLGDQTNYYESPKALGVLYRSIQVRIPQHLSKGDKPTQKRVPYGRHPFYAKLVDICVVKQVTRGLMTEERRLEIKKAFRSYATELRGIKSIYSIGRSPLSEEEVFMGTILAHATNRRSRDDMAVRLREVSSQLVDRVRMFFQGYRDDGANKQESLHLWLVRSMYGLQCALAEEVDRIGDRIIRDWKEAQSSFGMIALRSAYECLDVMDKRRPDPRKPKPQS
jgi:RNA-dependent RNA polymerase